MRAAATSTAFSLLSPSRLRTSTPTTSSLPFRRRLRLAAMATAASSFHPEAARSPPAVEPPAPPLSKVTPLAPRFEQIPVVFGSGQDLI